MQELHSLTPPLNSLLYPFFRAALTFHVFRATANPGTPIRALHYTMTWEKGWPDFFQLAVLITAPEIIQTQ